MRSSSGPPTAAWSRRRPTGSRLSRMRIRRFRTPLHSDAVAELLGSANKSVRKGSQASRFDPDTGSICCLMRLTPRRGWLFVIRTLQVQLMPAVIFPCGFSGCSSGSSELGGQQYKLIERICSPCQNSYMLPHNGSASHCRTVEEMMRVQDRCGCVARRRRRQR